MASASGAAGSFAAFSSPAGSLAAFASAASFFAPSLAPLASPFLDSVYADYSSLPPSLHSNGCSSPISYATLGET